MNFFKQLFIILSSIILLHSCSTSPYNVNKEDTQVVLNTDLGTIIDVVPVKIKGDPSDVMAVIGAVVGGVLAENIGGESQSEKEFAVMAGAAIGGVIGYYSTVKLGEHNGFQYSISIDDEEKPIGVIQGIDKDKDYNFKTGDRVSVVYGYKVRVLPSKN
jgi:outer membrane lipoprotein SlyB